MMSLVDEFLSKFELTLRQLSKIIIVQFKGCRQTNGYSHIPGFLVAVDKIDIKISKDLQILGATTM